MLLVKSAAALAAHPDRGRHAAIAAQRLPCSTWRRESGWEINLMQQSPLGVALGAERKLL